MSDSETAQTHSDASAPADAALTVPRDPARDPASNTSRDPASDRRATEPPGTGRTASPIFIAGATCLVVGPLAGLVSVVIERTISGKTADLAAAYTSSPGVTQFGLGLNVVASLLTATGLIWLAWTAHRRTPRLATTGAILAVLGLVSVIVDDSFHLAGALVVQGMSAAQAEPLLEWLTGGAMTAAVASELADIGVILLAIAAVAFGTPRWGAGLIIVGVICEGVGFAAGLHYLPAVGFALATAGYLTAIRASVAAHDGPGTPGSIDAPAGHRRAAPDA